MARFYYYLILVLLVITVQIKGQCTIGRLKTSTIVDQSGEFEAQV
jgi:hypothetical protein